jgi:hypothetical protein
MVDELMRSTTVDVAPALKPTTVSRCATVSRSANLVPVTFSIALTSYVSLSEPTVGEIVAGARVA